MRTRRSMALSKSSFLTRKPTFWHEMSRNELFKLNASLTIQIKPVKKKKFKGQGNIEQVIIINMAEQASSSFALADSQRSLPW